MQVFAKLQGTHPSLEAHGSSGLHGQEHGSGSNHGRRELQNVVLLEHALNIVGAELNLLGVGTRSPLEASQEGINGGDSKLKLEGAQHHRLHVQNLLAGVGAVSDVNEIADL